MRTATGGIVASTPTLVIEPPGRRRLIDLREVWRYRDVLFFLVWRDVKLRYRQTAVGALWVLLQPLLPLAVLSVVFGGFAAMPSDGVAYTSLVLAGLLPWLFVSQSLGTTATSLVTDQSIVTRVYFPRIIVPLARVVRGLVEHFFGLAVMVPILAFLYRPGPARFALLVAGVVLASLLTFSLGVVLATLNARYRDAGNAVPFLTQVWMFASPIVYPLSVVPEEQRAAYALNPMAGVIELYRVALLDTTPDARVIAIGVGVTALMLLGAVALFANAEPRLADQL